MTRLRLATLLTALLALSGAAAMPARPADLLRPAHSVSWWRAGQCQSRLHRTRSAIVSAALEAPRAVQPAQAPLRSLTLPDSLFQRPPPFLM